MTDSIVRTKTENSPKKVILSDGIEIIEDITSIEETAGVDTLEGRIGPLLLADDSQSHFIEMFPRMFVEEHPHSTGSIIYTVSGKWVLCSGGKRHLMCPGSLFKFTANTPTGYEVPFDEPAYILIFKGNRTSKDEEEFVTYLKDLAARLKENNRNGTPFTLDELPENHPALQFGRSVNPEFKLPSRK